jgi:hypothetical protein
MTKPVSYWVLKLLTKEFCSTYCNSITPKNNAKSTYLYLWYIRVIFVFKKLFFFRLLCLSYNDSCTSWVGIHITNLAYFTLDSRNFNLQSHLYIGLFLFGGTFVVSLFRKMRECLNTILYIYEGLWIARKRRKSTTAEIYIFEIFILSIRFHKIFNIYSI